MKNPMQRVVSRARGSITNNISNVYVRLHAQYCVCEPELPTSVHPLELILVQPHTGAVSPHPIFTLRSKWLSFRVCNSYSKSHEYNLGKFPNVKPWALCFLLGTQKKAATGLWLSTGRNVCMAPRSGVHPTPCTDVCIFFQVTETACAEGINLPRSACTAAAIWAIASSAKAKWSQCWVFCYVDWIEFD